MGVGVGLGWGVAVASSPPQAARTAAAPPRAMSARKFRRDIPDAWAIPQSSLSRLSFSLGSKPALFSVITAPQQPSLILLLSHLLSYEDAAVDVVPISVHESGDPDCVDILSPGFQHDLRQGLSRLPQYEDSAFG